MQQQTFSLLFFLSEKKKDCYLQLVNPYNAIFFINKKKEALIFVEEHPINTNCI